MKSITIFIIFLNTLYANIEIPQTFEASFVQSVKNEENSTVTYDGEIKATIDKKALWIYKNPVSKKIYFSKGEFLIIEDELEQAIYGKTAENVDFFKILSNAKEKQPDTYEAICCDNTYTIKTQKNRVKSISYKDKMDNLITIDFQNVMYDMPIDDNIFKPEIPKGYDLLRR